MNNHILMYLACGQMIIEVRQLLRNKWARQPMDRLCTRVRQLLMEDLCVGVQQLHLGVRHLPLEDVCVGVRDLQVEYMNQSQTTPRGWMLFIGNRQLSMNK